MACSRCGEVCHCYSGVRPPNGAQMRPRFEVDSDHASASSAVLVDPEQYDASEDQFSASLEAPAVSTAQFIPDQPASAEEPAMSAGMATPAFVESYISTESENVSDPSPPRIASSSQDAGDPVPERLEVASELNRNEDALQRGPLATPDSWKEEVAARLNTYRAKRKPRPPKYPSLSLDFQPQPPPSGSGSLKSDLRTSLALEDWQQKISVDRPPQTVRVVEEVPPPPPNTPASARVIEFPRFFAPEEVSPDQLAEPVCEHPRILDAPEVEMPAPALGGIVLDTTDEPKAEERPGFEMPLHSASIARRALAASVDGAVIISASMMFGYIFLQLARALPPPSQLLAAAMLVGTVLWVGYQYLLLTYSGTTPGLRLAKLQLIHFDGSAVLRSTRRWRVLASILSAVSLGLGFAWCFLDEDALCWHDRITRTHLAPRD